MGSNSKNGLNFLSSRFVYFNKLKTVWNNNNPFLLDALKHPSIQEMRLSARLVSEYKERLYWHIRKIVIRP